MEIEILEFRFMESGKTQAFVDVKIGDLIVRDFRVIKEDGKRPHVKVPFATYKDHAGQIKFRPIVILPNEVRGEVDLLILNAYQREKELGNATGKQP